MTPAGTVTAQVLLAAAAALAALTQRRAPQHGPIAFALGATISMELVRSVLGGVIPAREQLAMHAAVFALSTWSALKVFKVRELLLHAAYACWAVVLAWILWAPRPDAWWEGVPILGLATSVAMQAAAIVAYRMQRGPVTIAQHVALSMFLGDVAGLILGRDPHIQALQSAAVSAFVCVVQVMWLIRQRWPT